MIPNIVRGDRMAGLMSYLVGPGRSNEHTEPHLVAGDPALMAWYDDDELSQSAAQSIAAHLDRPRKAFNVDVNGGHVWHCSLSLRAEEGMLTDDRWEQIAGDFIAAMEFDDNEGTKAPCRWAAVRHGLSSRGNDHIHLVVNLVREDGTKASIHNDFKRAQAASRALEHKYGLEPLESTKAERATRGYDPAERESEARRRAEAKYARNARSQGGRAPEWKQLSADERMHLIAAETRTAQPRAALALKVRACAAASQDEAEFVRRMRRAGLLVRARYAEGRTDVVTGYSVAFRPSSGERPIWYGGGHLGRDLTLPRLRDGWPDTPTGAMTAAAEWTAAKRGRRVVAPGRETRDPNPELWDKQNRDLARVVDRLRAVDIHDRDTWATVARQTAGALAAWSVAIEDEPGDLAAAAEALSRSAQTYKKTIRPDKAGTVSISGTAMLLASGIRGGQGTVAQAAMVRQLLRLTQAVYEASVAGEQARQARLLADDTRARLVRVREALGPRMGIAAASAPAGPGLDSQAQAARDRINASEAHHASVPRPLIPPAADATRQYEPARPNSNRKLER